MPLNEGPLLCTSGACGSITHTFEQVLGYFPCRAAWTSLLQYSEPFLLEDFSRPLNLSPQIRPSWGTWDGKTLVLFLWVYYDYFGYKWHQFNLISRKGDWWPQGVQGQSELGEGRTGMQPGPTAVQSWFQTPHDTCLFCFSLCQLALSLRPDQLLARDGTHGSQQHPDFLPYNLNYQKHCLVDLSGLNTKNHKEIPYWPN